MDRAVRPGDDFFAFANGTWVKKTPIPADRSSYGIDTQVEEVTAQRTADLIAATAAGQAAAGSEAQKIADYYASFMDVAAIDAKGLAPLQPTLDRIAAIATRRDLARYIGGRLRADVDILNATNVYTDNLFDLWIAQDLDNPARYVPFLVQGGLGMPDRDYYLDASPRMTELRGKYVAHIAAVFGLAGIADGGARAERVFGLEHRMAEVHWSREDTNEVTKGNNHWSRADLDARAPGLDWAAALEACGLGGQQDFVVWQPSAMVGLSALASSEPIETWKDYLVFHAIDHAAVYLPRAFDKEAFSFYGTALSGVPEQRERWKRAVDATSTALGDAVGKLYVGKYFPPSEKARVEAMVRNILAAFRARIDRLSWMAPETKARAKAKLDALKVGVGYPDKWLDYSGLQIIRGDARGNLERVERFDLQRKLRKLGQRVDRSEWVMTPQTVNAVNLPAMNALNFPAAILQPPYLDPGRPESMDYGATGATIGHEISHSFDDQGALFDAAGRLSNWWTEADGTHFQASGAALAKQYDLYRPFPDAAVNGKQTLSENIADVAGLAAAYDAFVASLKGKPAQVAQGLSGDQQFFLAFAQSWRSKAREAALRRQLITDVHAPEQYRADAVRNIDAWYGAFDVKPGQALYLAPGDRVRVW
jgi:predicted metalloendopeptidase